MDQVDHRLGVRYPAGLLNKKLLNTKAPRYHRGAFSEGHSLRQKSKIFATSLCEGGEDVWNSMGIATSSKYKPQHYIFCKQKIPSVS